MTAKKNCFVVGPIGAPDSPERIHADWVLEEIINPVMAEFPFVVHRSDKLNHPGLIDTQMINHLLNDDLVIADLTTLNPNAFYEIGIRHMAQKPIIHMHKAGEKIPFDVSLYRSLEFSLVRPSDLRDARASLKGAVQAVLADGYKVDNPITHTRGVLKIHEQASDPQRVLLDAIEGLANRVGQLESNSRFEDLTSRMRGLSNEELKQIAGRVSEGIDQLRVKPVNEASSAKALAELRLDRLGVKKGPGSEA
jgi:hypothetical protein